MAKKIKPKAKAKAKAKAKPKVSKPRATKEAVVSDIGVRLRQINTNVDRPSPEQPEAGRVRMNKTREDEIRAGRSNLGAGDILIVDFKGDPEKISKEENDRTDNVGVEVKTLRRGGAESITTYTAGKTGDGRTEKDGDAPFDADIRPEKDEGTHLNLFHLQCTGGDHMQAFIRQYRITDDGVRHESDWLGATDGEGFRIGAQ